jgi:hypothetical protein
MHLPAQTCVDANSLSAAQTYAFEVAQSTMESTPNQTRAEKQQIVESEVMIIISRSTVLTLAPVQKADSAPQPSAMRRCDQQSMRLKKSEF